MSERVFGLPVAPDPVRGCGDSDVDERPLGDVKTCGECGHRYVGRLHLCGHCQREKYDRFNRRHRHPASARFHEILRELGYLHDRKQSDYGKDDDPFANVRGSEEWGVDGWIGAMVRASDKTRRLQSLIRNGKLENESAEDSLRDLAVYAVIALVLFEQSKGTHA